MSRRRRNVRRASCCRAARRSRASAATSPRCCASSASKAPPRPRTHRVSCAKLAPLECRGAYAVMMSEADRRKAADILIAAEKVRKQAVQISKTWPDITIDDAYAISTEVCNRKIAAGAKLIGHKVGLTSKAMQRSSQIDEPDFGYLLDDMMIADGARIPHENYCVPRVEIELAFILGKPLRGPGISLP